MDYFTTQLEQEFNQLSWHEVYSFIEFSLASLNSFQAASLEKRLNDVFHEEGVQYKINKGQVTGLMSEIEANEISNVQDLETNARTHINKSIELFNKRPIPDYSNSIKESISAVEAVAREITGDESAVLNNAIKKIDIHPALKQGLEKIYSWTSDEGGLRHALKNENGDSSGEIEARYMLVLCSALVNFLKEKYKN